MLKSTVSQGTIDALAYAKRVPVVQSLQVGVPEAADPDADIPGFIQTGYPEYTRRHELLLSHLSVYRGAVSALTRKMVLLGVCELAKVTPPDVNLGSVDFDGEKMIRECVEIHVRALEAQEEQLRLKEEEATRRRFAALRSRSPTKK